MTRYAVQTTHSNGDVLYLRRTPRGPNHRNRNVWADAGPKWTWYRADALRWAKRETAQKWADQLRRLDGTVEVVEVVG